MPGVDGTTAPPPASVSTDVPAERELQRNSRAASGYHGVIITANGKYQGRINIGSGVYRYCEVADTAQQAAIKRALALRAGLHCIDEPKPRVQRGKGTSSCSHMCLLCTQCDCPSFRAGTIAKNNKLSNKRATASRLRPAALRQLNDRDCDAIEAGRGARGHGCGFCVLDKYQHAMVTMMITMPWLMYMCVCIILIHISLLL
jgi:hypothetical protein